MIGKTSAIGLIVFTLTGAGTSPSASARPTTRPVVAYSVDLQRAVLATPAGRRVRAEIRRRRAAEERRIRGLEKVLESQRAELAPQVYRERFEQIQAAIAAAESRLNDAQDELLAPVLSELRALIRSAEGDQKVFFESSREAPVGLDSACDRTTSIVKAYLRNKRNAKPELGPANDACRFRGFLFVDFDRVISGLPQSRAAVARLEELRSKRQADIEQQKKRLETLKERAQSTGDARWREEIDHRARQLDESFSSYQREIKQAEAETQNALYDRVERALKKVLGRKEGLLFVEYFGDRPKRARSCEVSAWTSQWMTGQAGSAGLVKACPLVKP